MARWRLVAPHYLAVPGVRWEYKEIDRTTGKQRAVTFDVPTLLSPENPEDWNHHHGHGAGEIIVTDGNDKPDVRDIVFNGPPTPDMVPLDEAAKKISDGFASKWKHPIESLTGSYADEMMKQLEGEIIKAKVSVDAPKQVEGMAELVSAMAAMMKQNQELIALMTSREGAPTGATSTGDAAVRRA